MKSYTVALFAHVLVVVYLLGADLGRACVARISAGARLAKGLAQLQTPALVSWVLILAAAWIGTAKPF